MRDKFVKRARNQLEPGRSRFPTPQLVCPHRYISCAYVDHSCDSRAGPAERDGLQGRELNSAWCSPIFVRAAGPSSPRAREGGAPAAPRRTAPVPPGRSSTQPHGSGSDEPYANATATAAETAGRPIASASTTWSPARTRSTTWSRSARAATRKRTQDPASKPLFLSGPSHTQPPPFRETQRDESEDG
jgi:hypothetical protein